MTFYAAISLNRHVVVACDDRWTYCEAAGTCTEARAKVWRVNDQTVATGSGLMIFVEAWATQHLPRVLGQQPVDVHGLAQTLAGMGRALAKDHAGIAEATRISAGAQGIEQCATLLLAGVGRYGETFLLCSQSGDGFEPRLQCGPGHCFHLGFTDQAKLNEDNLSFMQTLGRVAMALPTEAQAAEVSRALPALVRRVAEHDEWVGPTGHVAVAGTGGVSISAF